ncbi:MAG: cytosine deaminase [Pseudomonadota bacterium]
MARNFSAQLESGTYSLRNIRLASTEGLRAIDMLVSNGKVDWLGPQGARADLPRGPDLAQAIVWPLTVDCHTHLDKGLVVHRSPNPDGTFDGASQSASADHETYQNAEDVRRRAEFALKSAFAHGTAAVRSHVDVGADTFDRNFGVLCELAGDWRGRIELQLCPFTGIYSEVDWFDKLAASAAAQPASGVLSIFIPPSGEFDAALDDVFTVAARHGVELDFHVDENLDPASRGLDAVARAALRHGFERPVLAGHCCALSVQPDDVVDATLDRVVEAGIGVVSLPLCNGYLMDRHAGRTPRQRGIAPVHEMRKRGIPVALASDNVRDGYHAYGDLDLPQLFREAVRMMHLDHPFEGWAAAVTATPAALMGLDHQGRLAVGQPADFMIFEARTWPEFVSRSAPPYVIVRGGKPVSAALPDFAELDDLEGMKL